MRPFTFFLLCILCLSLSSCERSPKGTFVIENGKFIVNGEEIQIISGEMHYPRVPKEYWKDRLQRAKAMGINTVSTYVFWNFHERQKGEFDFEGQADLAEFIRLAKEEGLYVILRPGPYVCAEWDFGGYPHWLLNEEGMTYRTRDPKFLEACERYLNKLGEELKHLTITNGGNILMVQVENEYGSFGDDKVYLTALKEMIEKAGFNVPLMTCDGGGQIAAGHIDGVFPTVNGVFGEDLFRIVDQFKKGGPYFVAEFYPAWFDVWGQRHSQVNYGRPTEQLDWMLKNGISVSMYMFHGGTNFWYTNGANTANGYAPQPTSYDYDAPLGEWGNAYPKYHKFRETIQKYLPEGKTLPDVPADNPTTSFAEITLTQSAPLSSVFKNRVTSEKTLSMEDLKQDFGYIHYETTVNEKGKQKLSIHALRDYAVILLNGERVGSIDRRYNSNSIDIDVATVPAKLEILVENGGRVNYGLDIQNNRKGITEKVMLGDTELKNWIITSLPLYKENISAINFEQKEIKGVPALHRGSFTIVKLGDTFIDMSKWRKGAVWINGQSIGKFWNVGPQQTLYVPAPWLKVGENEIVVFEMEDSGNRTIAGLDQPILNVLGADINYMEMLKRDLSKSPIIDAGDKLLTTELKISNDWHEFNFIPTSMRHCAIEILSTHKMGKHSSLREIELIDNNGNKIDKLKWKIVYASSEKARNNIGIAENLIDSDISSFWHTEDGSVGCPHTIIIDMGEIYSVKGIRLLSGAFLSGQIKDINVYGRPQFFLFK